MKTIATCFHMPGAPQEPPGHRSTCVFTCRGHPGPSPHPSPGPAPAKPEQARPGSNLVGPSHARPSQKAKAQDENPREGCSKSAFWIYSANILNMCTHAQDACFHVPRTPTRSPGGRFMCEFTCHGKPAQRLLCDFAYQRADLLCRCCDFYVNLYASRAHCLLAG